MSDDQQTTEAPAPAPEAPKAETFSLEYVQGLRSEAAKYRNEKKTAVDEAKAAKDAEWQAKLEAQLGETRQLSENLGDAWVELAKLYAALDAEVPTPLVREFAGLLKGSDEDAIRGSAESAKKLLGFTSTFPAVDPTQGTGGGVIPLNGDPIIDALKRAVGSR